MPLDHLKSYINRDKFTHNITLEKAKKTIYSLSIEQRLHLNSIIFFIFYIILKNILGADNSIGAYYIFIIFWCMAIGNDLIVIYKKIYSSVPGKSILLLLFGFCTNFSICIANQIVNDITAIDPTKFPRTVIFLTTLSIPLFIALGFAALGLFLIATSPIAFILHATPDEKTRELIFPWLGKPKPTLFRTPTKIIQFISLAIFCGFIFSIFKSHSNEYDKFTTKTAKSFLYYWEMYPKSLCKISNNQRVAFISDEKILVSEKTQDDISFKIASCLSLD